jgi:hypothetical protein
VYLRIYGQDYHDVIMPSDVIALSLCAGTLRNVCTRRTSPTDTFLRMHPSCVTHELHIYNRMLFMCSFLFSFSFFLDGTGV